MAIKINWQELQKRIISWQEVEKVMLNGVQIRPEQTGDNYLCFTSVYANDTLSLRKTGSPTAVWLEISRDKVNWTDYTIWDTIAFTNAWDKVYWRNKSATPTNFSNYNNYYRFNTSWLFHVSWDVNYLLCKDSTTTLTNYCFRRLFRQTDITSAPILSATTLAPFCYNEMFSWCPSLNTPPVLSTFSVASTGCCYQMFYWSSLYTLPSLSATTLWDMCYQEMFSWCNYIKMSETQTWEYQTPYRIPTSWTWIEWNQSTYYMFAYTWWTFTGTPNINQTYYTSNIVI